MTISKVGIVGSGLMGSGIAQVVAQVGTPTVLVKATGGEVDSLRDRVEGRMAKAVDTGRLEAEVRDTVVANLSYTATLDDLKGCGLVVESIVEDLETKKTLFRTLDERLGPEAILASNTSTLSITSLASATGEERRRRFLGCHFFNPPVVMGLVEVVPTVETDPAVVETVRAFMLELGKTPIVVRDSRGFMVNRLLAPYLLDAVRLLERGLGTIADFDTAMREAAGMPMGPFELIDYIGIDVVHAMASNLYEEYRSEAFAPPELLNRMLTLGFVGRKGGRGFYDYTAKPPAPNEELVRGFKSP
ncbi:MAG: 3-hydroxyacyl-CoA dehydrogenase family protein [Nitrospinae bacterium]|nr:3-hydroxyacyl-CoA dehydrogenase family protein [Nitrospinota bacterium]